MKNILKIEFQYLIGRNYALVWLLFHPRFILKKRSITQKLRRVKDNYLLKLCSEKAIFSIKNI